METYMNKMVSYALTVSYSSYHPNQIVSFLMAGNCFSMVSSKDSCMEQTSRNSVKVHFFSFFSFIHC